MKTTDERVTELEIRFMEQQVLLDDLGDQIERHADRPPQAGFKPSGRTHPATGCPNEKPPHY